MRYLLALALFLLVAPAYAGEAAVEVFASVSCANSTTAALAASDDRQSALFVNNSAQTIWIAINEAATTTTIPLNANGGSYYIFPQNHPAGNYDSEAVNCIVASGTGNLTVIYWGTR